MTLLNAIHGMDGQPLPVPREGPHRGCYLPVLVSGRPVRDRTRVFDDYSAQLVKLGHGVAFGFDVLAVGGGHDGHPLDRAILPRRNTDSLVNIAHIPK